MLKIEMLRAGHGDCLWIEYGDPQHPRRILIDGGATGTHKRALRPKLLGLPEKDRRFELLMVTHIDADHIAGVLELLEDKEAGFQASDIWFNGYRHLPDENPDTLGPVQGEKLTDLLVKPGITWNGAFGKGAVVVRRRASFPESSWKAVSASRLLSPTAGQAGHPEARLGEGSAQSGSRSQSRSVPKRWSRPKASSFWARPMWTLLRRRRSRRMRAEANGSSIAVLAEFEGRRICSPATPIPASSRRRSSAWARTRSSTVDACKLPHHGSKANVSRPLLEALDCKVYLFSTNGAHFKHPDRQAVARVIKWGGAESK